MLKIKNKKIGWLGLAVLVILLDQLSKFWVLKTLSFQTPKIIISGCFNFYLDFNSGAAFSFLSHAGHWSSMLFLSLAVLASLICTGLILLGANQKKLFLMGLSLVMGGALGNAIDRVCRGHVIDFIQWYWGNYFWPTFNLADTAICVGVLGIILSEWMGKNNNG